VDINSTLLGQMIAFGLFVWFCKAFVWPLIMEVIEERQTIIADGLAAASKGSRALEEAEQERVVIVDAARGQAREIVDQANGRGTSIVDEARVAAESERERILASAKAEVEQEVSRAREELRGQVASIAIAGAEKIVSKEIDAASHKELLDNLAAQI
jgi:F-type H+-transporting ATPase subunit b|tara:strand:- start:386 stop:856 length:471 start_codon:yes stop_codon:yes gene_type:complete